MKLGIPKGPLDRLAALDPTRFVGPRLVGVARQVPGVAAGERQLQRFEDAILRELGRRLDEARGEPAQLTEHASTNGTGPTALDTLSLPERMETLLRRSIDQTPSEGERALAEMVIRELVPDEARVLAALADGSPYAVIDIIARSGSDRGRPLVANVSNVGRAAGVVLPDRVPVYVTHMLSLGLARRGPEDHSLGDVYDILLTEPAVMKAREHPGSGLRPPRVVRATLRISELGETVWRETR